MTRWKRWKAALLLTSVGILAAAGAGSCLPNNFYADLAGTTLTGIVDAVVRAWVEQLLTQPA